jgi:hypothetical protein
MQIWGDDSRSPDPIFKVEAPKLEAGKHLPLDCNVIFRFSLVLKIRAGEFMLGTLAC